MSASRLRLVRVVKIIHTLASIGLGGGLAALFVLLAPGPGPELRRAVVGLHAALLVPSVVVCILSGIASMLVHRPYFNALWAWAKALLGLPALMLAIRLEQVAADPADPRERSMMVAQLVLVTAQVVLGIWRPQPRLGPR